MLDGFNDVTALNDMDCKYNLVILKEQWVVKHKYLLVDSFGWNHKLFGVYSSRTVLSRKLRRSGAPSADKLGPDGDPGQARNGRAGPVIWRYWCHVAKPQVLGR